jgi:hypothetical protein
MKRRAKRLGNAHLALNESSLKKSHFCPLSPMQFKRIKLVCFGKTYVNASTHFFPYVSGVKFTKFTRLSAVPKAVEENQTGLLR